MIEPADPRSHARAWEPEKRITGDDSVRVVQFGDVCHLQNGAAFKPSDWNGRGLPIVRIQNLNDESKGFNYTDIEVPEKFHIESGDLLFSWSGTPGTSFGAFFWKRGKAYLNQHIFKVTVDRYIVDLNYLKSAINSKLDIIIDAAHGGVGLKHITKGKLEAVTIPLPPLEEQKHIAAILDKADALRRKRQQAIDLTDQLLRSIFLDMFGDPVTNPKGWDVSPLKTAIVHANNGLSRRRKTSENTGDIVLRLQDVHYDGIRFEKDLNRIQLDDKEKQRYKLENSDILFIRVNGNPKYVGRSAVFHNYDEDVYHNDHLIRIKLSEEYDAEFLCYLINYSGSRSIISPQLKTSAGQHTISQGGIEKLEFYRPPIDLQTKFVEIVEKVNETRTTFRGYEEEINNLFSSLTQQAFRGELTKQIKAA